MKQLVQILGHGRNLEKDFWLAKRKFLQNVKQLKKGTQAPSQPCLFSVGNCSPRLGILLSGGRISSICPLLKRQGLKTHRNNYKL